jgi:hypothetical protein
LKSVFEIVFLFQNNIKKKKKEIFLTGSDTLDEVMTISHNKYIRIFIRCKFFFQTFHDETITIHIKDIVRDQSENKNLQMRTSESYILEEHIFLIYKQFVARKSIQICSASDA